MKIGKSILLLLVIYIFSIVKSIEIHKNPNIKNSNVKNPQKNPYSKDDIGGDKEDKTLKKIQVGRNGLNDTLYWGTYKPQQYFGLKTRSIEPINTGLIWSTPNINYGFNRFNYKTSQGGDGVASYKWLKHDGKNFGVQEIQDSKGNLNLTTSFVKKSGKKGGDWSIRVSGKTNETNINSQPITSLIYFIHDESIKRSRGETNFLSVQNHKKGDTDNINGDLQIKGEHKEIGKYTLYFSDISNKEKQQETLKKYKLVDEHPDIEGWRYYGVSKFTENNWDILPTIFDMTTKIHLNPVADKWVKDQRKIIIPTLPNIINEKSNIIAIQRVLTVPFDVVEEIVKSLFVGSNFDNLFNQHEKQFDDKFNLKFNYEKLRKHPEYVYKVTKESLSSLIGGFGYWYGSSLFESSSGRFLKTKPVALYSATPSRTAFPRGFLWDEGFHQLVVSSFDIDLTIESLSHWFNIMNKNGWIPREQILGREAQSMVPDEFVKQSPIIANPPTIILAVNKLIELAEVHKKAGHKEEFDKIFEFINEAYPRIQRFYQYYWKTQKSGALENAFRWRDRKVNHTLASGLDDYPRADIPSDAEIHVDLNSWMAFFAQSLAKISEFIDKKEDTVTYQNQFNAIFKVIEDYHWDPEENLFQDILLHPNGTKEFIKTYGYLNYFPLMLGILPEDSPKIPPLVSTLKDVNGIWSRWGIRSLSIKDKHFGTNENYWRGPIWININYLFTHSMYKKYMKNSLSVSDLYISLRFNLLSNVGKKYIETGFFWEQYDPINGNGQRNHPFNGWTSLISLIISEQY
ncbi:hypothetical protein DICPUDRAFT_53711 [Dictyostelium purpureum]|uniref:Mannosyl-oligosaccharide glucosidase n=1 Tax=Dictyostelium purpureum TaxID=5786 RepID=F0ZE04_DICPU|nr:uncharacterized protein DICPUDRAFT_53711 [Dictyostelium purpureum]EGC37795.1 hypothetical protein DICPUDRAFT_53711 [Dictyostelium purpureum]|eukprot:XP_003285640.1 hypothetical protein DICPUDRAFT_53711 [Dictyostelium purpureum]